MLHEHTDGNDRFEKIAALSNNDTPSANGCTTYQCIAYTLLQEFEQDLHKTFNWKQYSFYQSHSPGKRIGSGSLRK
jgi:iron-sulfur cluster repair protein YtfE (RIC family)